MAPAPLSRSPQNQSDRTHVRTGIRKPASHSLRHPAMVKIRQTGEIPHAGACSGAHLIMPSERDAHGRWRRPAPSVLIQVNRDRARLGPPRRFIAAGRAGRLEGVDAADYNAWYTTPRGAWVGDAEFRLLQRLLRPERGESLLDVGCGTGYFTRRLAREAGLRVVGLDPDVAWLDYARSHGKGAESYCGGRAERLPFADGCFDRTVSVAALCFVDDVRGALREILRVTRKRFAVGLLNRHSLLHRDKGRNGGSGAYHGARWHTEDEVRALFAGLPAANLTLCTAIFVPQGGPLARIVERVAPSRLPFGAFLVATGDVRLPPVP